MRWGCKENRNGGVAPSRGWQMASFAADGDVPLRYSVWTAGYREVEWQQQRVACNHIVQTRQQAVVTARPCVCSRLGMLRRRRPALLLLSGKAAPALRSAVLGVMEWWWASGSCCGAAVTPAAPRAAAWPPCSSKQRGAALRHARREADITSNWRPQTQPTAAHLWKHVPAQRQRQRVGELRAGELGRRRCRRRPLCERRQAPVAAAAVLPQCVPAAAAGGQARQVRAAAGLCC